MLRVNARPAGRLTTSDPVSLAAALAATPGRAADGWTWSDWDDELWGGAVTVATERPGRFVFPYPARGGHVLVNGAEVAPAASVAGSPLLVLDLAAGTSRVEVRFTERGAGEILAVIGAAGLVAGLIGFLLAIRTTPAAE
ncbi:MAG: hypothetical protein K8T90_12320 [Planctomycetes bacterium]|nr:hypothetical protein [Planctomycetota bacterium]